MSPEQFLLRGGEQVQKMMIESYKAENANSLSYFLPKQACLIIKGIRPFLGTVSRAAGIDIMTAGDAVQGLMALASLGQPALS